MGVHLLLTVGIFFNVFSFISTCPSDWTSHNGSCYKYFNFETPWNSAKSACSSLAQNGKLVEVGSSEENNFLVNFIKSHRGQVSWLGSSDIDQEGHFEFASSHHTMHYFNWAAKEPNNHNNEDCLALDIPSLHGQWHDADCSLHFSYVCEVVGDVVTGPGPTRQPLITDNAMRFRNTSLSWEERVNDLVGRLSLEEIQEQMSRGGAGRPAPHIDRLGIKDYQFWTGCNRGDVSAPGNATAFPQAIGIAASFDPDLRFRVAEATAIEVRAKHIVLLAQGKQGTHTGLSCFSPDLDILKHPFWGRNQETHGEDPYMTSVYADKFIKGLQGDHPRYARATAGCKHFAVHSGPEGAHGAGGHNRHSFDSKASMADMRMTYLPAYRQCVDSGTYSFMSSYNAINGVPVAANKWLLTDILRNEWNFTGYVLADAGAIESMVHDFHYTQNEVDTVAACVNAGLNIETSGNLDHPYFNWMIEAINQGKLTEKLVRERVKPLFYTRMRLGEFDPPHMNPYMSLKMSEVESAEHQKLAIETAMKSFVLLKNNGILPLKHSPYQNVAIVGPFADETKNLYGDYAANTDDSFKSNVMTAMRHIGTHVHQGNGCNDVKCGQYNAGQVTRQLTNAHNDLIFVALGTGQQVEAEGHDKYDYNLPGHQKQLLMDVLSHAGNTPVILLLFAGSALDISFAESDSRVSAILSCFLPAQATGVALRHTLLNDANGAVPAGKLPFTWYKSEHDLGDVNDYSMDGKTYRYLHVDPLYPFGFGLSYTTFHYTNLDLPATVNAGQDLAGSVHVHNTGTLDADETVQVYIQWTQSGLPAPKLQLAWFDRVTIAKGGIATVHFKVQAKTMGLWVNNGWKISPGSMKLYVGGQQPNQKKAMSSNVLEANFSVHGSLNHLP